MLLLIHIPKTAGTSVKGVLSEFFRPSEVLEFAFQPEILEIPPIHLRKYQLVMGHCTYGYARYVGAETNALTFLRRPIAQALSLFFDLKDNGLLSPRATLSEVIASPDIQRILNLQSRWLASDDFGAAGLNCWYPSSSGKRRSIMKSPAVGKLGVDVPYPDAASSIRALTNQSLLEKAIARLETLRFVGITEFFEDSMRLLCQEFGWPPTARNPKLNARPKKRMECVDQEGLRRLEELLEIDRRLYDYALHLFQERLKRALASGVDQYERRLSESPRVAEQLVAFDGSVPGTGWHERERTDAGQWARWTAKVATIDMPLVQDSGVLLSFFVTAAITPTGLEDLKVSVNGVPIETRHYFQVSGLYANALFTGYVSREALMRRPGFTRIEFQTKETRRPCDIYPGSEDDRELGVMVSWVCAVPDKAADESRHMATRALSVAP